MDNRFIFRRLLNTTIILVLPSLLWASTPLVLKKDSLNTFQQEKDKKKSEEKGKPEPQVPDIREIPKAKKQSRPIIVKPNIKGKPIKVIRPKIKKP